MAYQYVKLTVFVDAPDDSSEDYAEGVVKDALLTDERIEYVEITRTSSFIER